MHALCVFDYQLFSLQVARLLMDTTTVQFYPNLFVLSTDIMDLLGDLVWNRIKKRAEFNEDGRFICYLPGLVKVFLNLILSHLSTHHMQLLSALVILPEFNGDDLAIFKKVSKMHWVRKVTELVLIVNVGEEVGLKLFDPL